METISRHALSPWHPLSPLAASRDDDRRLLALTRRDELAIVTNMVAASRISLLYAMSGNGKTSLINAGVVPFFAEQGYAVFTVRPRPPRARNDPRAAFRHCVLDQLPRAIASSFDRHAVDELAALVERSERSDLKPFTDRLASLVDVLPREESMQQSIRDSFEEESTRSIRGLLLRMSEVIGRDRPILVVLDQFEELFVHFSNKEALSEYVDDLGAVWADPALNVRLLFSMREDWVGSMIVLRRAIPEVFKDTYRLLPLTETSAAHVLTDSLPQGDTFEAAAVTRIISDVADYYRRIEKRRLGRIDLDRSKATDRLVDLSALQIVADRLWQTRHDADRPFSLAHYEQLAPGHPSPAGEVLDRYLADLLATPDELKRLQIDALYALTDGERHRRASALTVVTREIADSKLRAAEPPADEASVRNALAPLAEVAIVKPSETAEGTEYELAHDFLVRAVVGLRQQLDLDRAGERGRAEVEQKRKDQRLENLEKRDDTLTTILQIAPVVGLFGLLWSTIALWSGDYNSVRLSISAPGPGILVFLAFIVLFVAGAISRHRASLITAAIGIILPTIVLISIAPQQNSLQQLLKQVRTKKGIPASELIDVNTATLGDAYRLLLSGRFDRDEVEPALLFLQRAMGSTLNMRTIGGTLLGITFLTLLLLTLRTLASLQSSPKWTRFFLLWWADLLDILTTAVPIAATIAACALLRVTNDTSVFAASVAAAITLTVHILIAVRQGSSLGLKAAGFGLDSTRLRRVMRQLVLLVWAVLNGFFLVPWLVAGALLIAFKNASVPDFLTGQRPRRPSEKPDETDYPARRFAVGKRPNLAAILSLVIVGLGQFYNGDAVKGTAMLVAAIAMGFTTFGIGWIIIAIWSAVDAYRVASGKAPMWSRATTSGVPST
jgi:TM2 domain-containing membrane protein YozV